MRRIAAALLVPPPPAPSWPAAGRPARLPPPNAAVKVSGTFGQDAERDDPGAEGQREPGHQHPHQGHRRGAEERERALANVAVYKWSGTTHTLVDSTFGTGPQMIPAQMGLTGLTAALKGARIGSRVVAVLPPKYGYGTTGQSQLQITGTDTLVWVIDLLQQYSSTQAATGSQVSNGGGGCRP